MINKKLNLVLIFIKLKVNTLPLRDREAWILPCETKLTAFGSTDLTSPADTDRPRTRFGVELCVFEFDLRVYFQRN